jgi:hypothetical protein
MYDLLAAFVAGPYRRTARGSCGDKGIKGVSGKCPIGFHVGSAGIILVMDKGEVGIERRCKPWRHLQTSK